MTRTQEEWEPCPPGEIGRLSGRLRGRRQRRRFLQSAAGLGVLTAGGGLAWWLGADWFGEPNYGGITCSQVRALAPAMLKRQLQPEDQQRIERHLAQCGPCRQLIESMMSAGDSRPS